LGNTSLNHVLGIKKARRDLLLALRKAALEHYAEVNAKDPSAPTELTDDDAKKLRSSATLFIAEFFFVLNKLDLTNKPTSLEGYLRSHNKGIGDKIKRLRESGSSITPSGLTVTRLEEGLLAEEKIEEIIADAREGFFRFDQSTLGALMIELMVKQSTNVHLSVLGRTGFLKITGRRPKYISSSGKLENLYQEFLSQIEKVFKD